MIIYSLLGQTLYFCQIQIQQIQPMQIEKIRDFIQHNSLEIACIAVSTAAYQIYQHFKQKEQPKSPQKTKKFGTVLSGTQCLPLKRSQSIHRIPNSIIQSQNSLLDQVQHLYNPACKIQKVSHLVIELGFKNIPSIKSPLLSDNKVKSKFGGQGFIPERSFIYRGSFVLEKNLYRQSEDLANPTSWLLAGPRKFLHFKPAQVKAAIVTCGGLCPGLNVVIREIYTTLTQYGCQQIYGVKYGFMGFYSGEQHSIKLYEKFVRELQYQGGTILGSSRGGFDADKIITGFVTKGINHVYVIGGDGTHRGIATLAEQLKKRKLEISIVGVPKTIDNDIPIIDKSFGFQTAVAESIRAIRSAYVESIGVEYGIGLVRLMGRDAGFIAMEATNASRDVNICLVPQFEFDLYGPCGIFQYIYEQLKIRRHLVIVVAEGAGKGVRDLARLSTILQRDLSGNIKLPDIGVYLKTQIIAYLKQKKLDASLKYIDPAYMIRTVPANSYDRKLCTDLATSAVHGAMAGFTSFTVGHINQNVAMIPIASLNRPNRITTSNRAWQRLLAYTGQPSFQNQSQK